MLDPDGCLARSEMPIAAINRRNGRGSNTVVGKDREINLAAGAAKKMLCALDERPANGCHRNPKTALRLTARRPVKINDGSEKIPAGPSKFAVQAVDAVQSETPG